MNRNKQKGYWDFDLTGIFCALIAVGFVAGILFTLGAQGIWHIWPEIRMLIHTLTA